MPKYNALTQELAWEKSRRELIRMIGAGLLEQLKCALRCRNIVKTWKEVKLKRLEKRLEE